MTLETRITALAAAIASEINTLRGEMSGGGSKSTFYALGSGSANLGTTLGTVPLATPDESDTGYSVASNEVTIGSDLNGKKQP